MGARQAAVDSTRLRITEAAVRLHEEHGPAATSFAAIAEAAGVTRLTLYRHFPDEGAMLAACSAHWDAAHPAPDVEAWKAVDDPAERLRLALTEHYNWLRDAAPMLVKVLRDIDTLPDFIRDPVLEDQRKRVAVLSRGLASDAAGRRRVRAALDLALSPVTWRTLCAEGGLSVRDAVDLMSRAVLAAAGRA